VNPYLVGAPAAGAGALLVVKSIFKNKENNSNNNKKGEKEQRRGTVTDDEASFACERVCASDRLLKRMGGLAKEPTSNACVTVCGMSATDSCAEACERVICANPHSVPAWNDQCSNRCKSECLRGRAA